MSLTPYTVRPASLKAIYAIRRWFPTLGQLSSRDDRGIVERALAKGYQEAPQLFEHEATRPQFAPYEDTIPFRSLTDDSAQYAPGAWDGWADDARPIGALRFGTQPQGYMGADSLNLMRWQTPADIERDVLGKVLAHDYQEFPSPNTADTIMDREGAADDFVQRLLSRPGFDDEEFQPLLPFRAQELKDLHQQAPLPDTPHFPSLWSAPSRQQPFLPGILPTPKGPSSQGRIYRTLDEPWGPLWHGTHGVWNQAYDLDPARLSAFTHGPGFYTALEGHNAALYDPEFVRQLSVNPGAKVLDLTQSPTRDDLLALMHDAAGYPDQDTVLTLNKIIQDTLDAAPSFNAELQTYTPRLQVFLEHNPELLDYLGIEALRYLPQSDPSPQVLVRNPGAASWAGLPERPGLMDPEALTQSLGGTTNYTSLYPEWRPADFLFKDQWRNAELIDTVNRDLTPDSEASLIRRPEIGKRWLEIDKAREPTASPLVGQVMDLFWLDPRYLHDRYQNLANYLANRLVRPWKRQFPIAPDVPEYVRGSRSTVGGWFGAETRPEFDVLLQQTPMIDMEPWGRNDPDWEQFQHLLKKIREASPAGGAVDLTTKGAHVFLPTRAARAAVDDLLRQWNWRDPRYNSVNQVPGLYPVRVTPKGQSDAPIPDAARDPISMPIARWSGAYDLPLTPGNYTNMPGYDIMNRLIQVISGGTPEMGKDRAVQTILQRGLGHLPGVSEAYKLALLMALLNAPREEAPETAA